MFEGLFTSILKQYLGKFVLGLDEDQLGISVWAGKIRFEQLAISPNAIEAVGIKLPISVKAGVIGLLELEIPWSKLSSQPVHALLSDVYITIGPNSAFDWTVDDQLEKEKRDKMDKIAARIEAAQKHKEELSKKAESESYLEKLTTKIVDNLQLEIRRIHIRYEDATTCPGKTFALGLSLGSLSVISTNGNWEPSFVAGVDVVHKLAQMNNLILYVRTSTELYGEDLDKMRAEFANDPSLADLKDGASNIRRLKNIEANLFKKDGDAATDDLRSDARNHLIPPISFQAKLSLCKTDNTSRPKVAIQQLVDRIALQFSREQYELVVEVLKYFDRADAIAKYRHYRPSVPVIGNAKLWWKFALRCILKERNQAREEILRRLFVLTRKERYISLHKRSLAITKEWMANPTRAQWDELREIEEEPRMKWVDIKNCMLVAEAEISKRLLDQKGRHANPHELIIRRDPEKDVALQYRSTKLEIQAQAEEDRLRELKMAKATKKRAEKEERRKRKEARRERRAKEGRKKKKKKKKGWSFWGKSKKVDSDGDEILSSSSSDEDGALADVSKVGDGSSRPSTNKSSKSRDAASKETSYTSEDGTWSITPEQRAEFFKVTGWEPENAAKRQAERMMKLPKDFILLDLAIQTRDISISLLRSSHNTSNASKYLLRLAIPQGELNVRIMNGRVLLGQLAPTRNIVVKFRLPDLRLQDYSNPETCFPYMIKKLQLHPNRISSGGAESQSKDDGEISNEEVLPLVDACINIQPIDGSCDSKINLSMQPLQVVYNKDAIAALANFLAIDIAEGSLDNLALTASKRVQEFSEEQKAKLQAAFEAHNTLLLDLEVKAPIVILPENSCNPASQILYIDLGEFKLSSTPKVEESQENGNDAIAAAPVMSKAERRKSISMKRRERARRARGELSKTEMNGSYDQYFFYGRAISVKIGHIDLSNQRNKMPFASAPSLDVSSSHTFKVYASEDDGNLIESKQEKHELQRCVGLFKEAPAKVYQAIDFENLLVVLFRQMNPSLLFEIPDMLPHFKKDPSKAFEVLILKYKVLVPAPSVLAEKFPKSAQAESLDNILCGIDLFGREGGDSKDLFQLVSQLTVEAHVCVLPDEICRADGYPKIVVRAAVPPVVANLSPLLCCGILSVVQGMDLMIDGGNEVQAKDFGGEQNVDSHYAKEKVRIAGKDKHLNAPIRNANQEKRSSEIALPIENRGDENSLALDTTSTPHEFSIINLVVSVSISEVSLSLKNSAGHDVLVSRICDSRSFFVMQGDEGDFSFSSSLKSIVMENRRSRLNNWVSMFKELTPQEHVLAQGQNNQLSSEQKEAGLTILRALKKHRRRERLKNSASKLYSRALLEAGEVGEYVEDMLPFIEVGVEKHGGVNKPNMRINVAMTELRLCVSQNIIFMLWNELLEPLLKEIIRLKAMNNVLSAASEYMNAETKGGTNRTPKDREKYSNEVSLQVDNGAPSAIIKFTATWRLADIALMVDEDTTFTTSEVPVSKPQEVLAYLRIDKLRATGKVEDGNTNANVSLGDMLIDDASLQRPPLLSFTNSDRRTNASSDSIKSTLDMTPKNTSMQLRVSIVQANIHPGFAFDFMRRFLQPMWLCLINITNSLAKLKILDVVDKIIVSHEETTITSIQSTISTESGSSVKGVSSSSHTNSLNLDVGIEKASLRLFANIDESGASAAKSKCRDFVLTVNNIYLETQAVDNANEIHTGFRSVFVMMPQSKDTSVSPMSSSLMQLHALNSSVLILESGLVEVVVCPSLSKSSTPDRPQGFSVKLDLAIPLLASMLEFVPTVTKLHEQLISIINLHKKVDANAKLKAQSIAQVALNGQLENRDSARAHEELNTAEMSIILRGATICVNVCHSAELYSTFEEPSAPELEERSALLALSLTDLNASVDLENDNINVRLIAQEISSSFFDCKTQDKNSLLRIGGASPLQNDSIRPGLIIQLNQSSTGTLDKLDTSIENNMLVDLGDVSADLNINDISLGLGVFATDLYPKLVQMLARIEQVKRDAERLYDVTLDAASVVSDVESKETSSKVEKAESSTTLLLCIGVRNISATVGMNHMPQVACLSLAGFSLRYSGDGGWNNGVTTIQLESMSVAGVDKIQLLNSKGDIYDEIAISPEDCQNTRQQFLKWPADAPQAYICKLVVKTSEKQNILETKTQGSFTGFTIDLCPRLLDAIAVVLFSDPMLRITETYMPLIKLMQDQQLERQKASIGSLSKTSSPPTKSTRSVTQCHFGCLRFILRTSDPSSEKIDREELPVVVIKIEELGANMSATSTVSSLKLDSSMDGHSRTSTASSTGISIHGFGVWFYPFGGKMADVLVKEGKSSDFLHVDAGSTGATENARTPPEHLSENTEANIVSSHSEMKQSQLGNAVAIVTPVAINLNFTQKIADVDATTFLAKGFRQSCVLQSGTVNMALSPIEVAFFLVLESTMSSILDDTGSLSSGEETAHGSNKLKIYNSHFKALQIFVDTEIDRQKEETMRINTSATPQRASSNMNLYNLHSASKEALDDEIQREGAMGASTSLLGLNLHLGIDEFIMTLLVKPPGASISRPALCFNIQNFRCDGNNSRIDEPFKVEVGLVLKCDHFSSRHIVWQPLIEPFYFSSEVCIPLLPSSEEDTFNEVNNSALFESKRRNHLANSDAVSSGSSELPLNQTVASVNIENDIQLNVTLPLIHDMVLLGDSFSGSGLDRDGSGVLDSEDLRDATNEAFFAPYRLENESGLMLEFWFPGDEIIQSSQKLKVMPGTSLPFRLPNALRATSLNGEAKSHSSFALGAIQDREKRRGIVSMRMDRVQKTVKELPINATGMHVRKIVIKSKDNGSRPCTAYVDWHVSVENGIHVIRVQSLLKIQNLTPRSMIVLCQRTTEISRRVMEEAVLQYTSNLKSLHLTGKSNQSMNMPVGKEKSSSEKLDSGFKVLLEAGNTLHVPVDLASDCDVFVSPLDEDDNSSTCGVPNSEDVLHYPLTYQWGVLSGLKKRSKITETIRNKREWLDFASNIDGSSSCIGINLNYRLFRVQSDYAVTCARKLSSTDNVKADDIGDICFTLHAALGQLDALGQMTLQLLPLLTIQNLLAKPIQITLYRDSKIAHASWQRYLSVGQTHTFWKLKCRGEADQADIDSNHKKLAPWHPLGGGRTLYTHWSYTMDGFQACDPIPLLPTKALPPVVSASFHKPINILDAMNRVQVHQIEHSRLAAYSTLSVHTVIFCPYWIRNLTSLPITYSHPRNPSGDSLMVKGNTDIEVAAGQNVEVIEETYENQRHYPFVGWSSKLLPTERHSWSDRKGECTESRTHDSFCLPSSQWEWTSNWKVDMGIGDKDGWMYAAGGFAGSGHFQHKHFFGAIVRRRRWTRRRTPKQERDCLGYTMFGPSKHAHDKMRIKILDSTWSRAVDLRAVGTNQPLFADDRDSPTQWDVVVKIANGLRDAETMLGNSSAQSSSGDVSGEFKETELEQESAGNGFMKEVVYGSEHLRGLSLHRTKLVQISPHYIISNKLSNSRETVLIRQYKSEVEGVTSRICKVKPGDHSEFHWADLRLKEKLATLTILNDAQKDEDHYSNFVHDDLNWTCAFELDHIGESVLSLFNHSNDRRRIVRINVHESPSLGSLIVTIRDENENEPLFRIVNNTFEKVTVRQHLPDDHRLNSLSEGVCRNSPQKLEPNEEIPFAWIDPLQKSLSVDVIIGGSRKNLDIRDITSHVTINLGKQHGSSGFLAGESDAKSRRGSVLQWRDNYGGHDESIPVRFGDPIAMMSVVDGLTWCAQNEGGIKGYIISMRSSHKTNPVYFRPFSDVQKEFKSISRKSSRLRKNESFKKSTIGRGVFLRDAVALCCIIDVAGGQEVRHLSMSKKGRLKWKKSGRAVGFRVMPPNSQLSETLDGIGNRMEPLLMDSEFTLHLLNAEHNSGIGCSINYALRSKSRNKTPGKSTNGNLDKRFRGPNFDPSNEKTDLKAGVSKAGKTNLIVNIQNALREKETHRGKGAKEHLMILKCKALKSLPSRQIFAYMELRESTRVLRISLSDDPRRQFKRRLDAGYDFKDSASSSEIASSYTTSRYSESATTVNTGKLSNNGNHGKENNAALSLMFRGVGISIIDSLETELLFLTFETVFLEARSLRDIKDFHLFINSLQIDNMMPDTRFPVLMQPRYSSDQKSVEGANNPPSIEISIVARKAPRGSHLRFFHYFMVAIQEFNLSIEEALLYRLNAILTSFGDGSLFTGQDHALDEVQAPITRSDRVKAILRLKNILTAGRKPRESHRRNSLSGGALLLMHHHESIVEQPIYNHFEIFQINPIQINVSFKRSMDTTVRTGLGGTVAIAAAPVRYLLDSISVVVAGIDKAPIRLDCLMISKLFQTDAEIGSKISGHYAFQAKKQALGLVGSIGILGNPAGLVKNLGTGVRSFFIEPAKAIRKGPKAFAGGAAKGTIGLLSGVFSGAGGSVSAVTGAVSSGIGQLTFDKDYIAARNKRNHKVKTGGAGTGAIEGVKALGSGLAGGITGVFLQPIKGAKDGGVGGFLKGIGKGAVGLIAKPVSGALEAVSNVTEGVANSAKDAGSKKKRNRKGHLRPRRILQGSQGRILVPYEPIEKYVRDYLTQEKVVIDMDTSMDQEMFQSTDSDKQYTQDSKETLYLFHIVLPDAPSLALVITTKSFTLIAVRPELVGDTHPSVVITEIFEDTTVSEKDTSNRIAAKAVFLSGEEKAPKDKTKKLRDIRICYVLPVNELESAKFRGPDSSETATSIYQKLKLRLSTPHKATGLRLSNLEKLLVQHLEWYNGEYGRDPKVSELELRKDMSKQAFRNAQWFPCLEECQSIISGLKITAVPRMNLNRILLFVKEIQKFLQKCVGDDEALGADDLVPATIYCLVAGCSKVLVKCRPLLIVRLIYELAPMSGEEEYCVANFEGALTHLATPKESDNSERDRLKDTSIDQHNDALSRRNQSKAEAEDLELISNYKISDSWLDVPRKGDSVYHRQTAPAAPEVLSSRISLPDQSIDECEVENKAD